jgi:hypothetical protein
MARDSNVEKFGRAVIARARDETLDCFERFAAGENVKGDDAFRAHEAIIRTLTPEQVKTLRFWVRYCVDLSIANFLYRVEELHDLEDLELKLGGTDIVHISDGLVGSLYGNRGWFAKFSKHGKFDEVSDFDNGGGPTSP